MGALGWILAIGLLIYVVYSYGKSQEDRDRKIDEMRERLDDIESRLNALAPPEQPKLIERD